MALIGSIGSTIAKSVLPAGSVLQVINATYSTQTVSSSSTYADTGLTATITPTSATSKILVLISQTGLGKEIGNARLSLRLLRDSTEIIVFERNVGFNNTTTINYVSSSSTCYLDSPSTTSATVYKTQFASTDNNAQVLVQASGSGVATTSTITLMEIAA
jgi:hypothetical protein